jgi:hypothetical protein
MVDYVHRLVVRGSAQAVRRLSRALYREYPRTVANRTWTEIVPFSFEALYKLAPKAARIEREVPCDPFELAAWPVRIRPNGKAEARYQFQTRNLEMAGFIQALARTQPQLRFVLVTFCMDDSTIESFAFSGSSRKKWMLPDRRTNFHWERARKKFGLAGDAVYDDDEAEQWAEEEMLIEAISHWTGRGAAAGRSGRYKWWNQPRLRDLDTERELALFAVIASVDDDERAKRSSRARRSRRKPSRRKASS